MIFRKKTKQQQNLNLAEMKSWKLEISEKGLGLETKPNKNVQHLANLLLTFSLIFFFFFLLLQKYFQPYL